MLQTSLGVLYRSIKILQNYTSAYLICETCRSGMDSCRESAKAHAGRSITLSPAGRTIAEAMQLLLIYHITLLYISSELPGVALGFPACQIAPGRNVILCLPSTGADTSLCSSEIWKVRKDSLNIVQMSARAKKTVTYSL